MIAGKNKNERNENWKDHAKLRPWLEDLFFIFLNVIERMWIEQSLGSSVQLSDRHEKYTPAGHWKTCLCKKLYCVFVDL